MTELIWDGKYDSGGNKVAPLRVSLPFQTVETINESAQERQRMLDLFSAGRDPEWRNRLIWGDKKYVLPSLLDEFAGKVNLIYIDPPFNVGADFSFTATIPDNPETEEEETATFIKEPSIIEQKAYRDTWGRGLDSYLQWFYDTTVLLRELLAEDGGVFVHLDWRVGHYAKIIMDEVFGVSNFVQEIIWQHQIMGGAHGRRFPKAHETVLWFAKSATYKFQHQDSKVRVPYSEYVRKTLQQDEDGRWFYTRRRMSRKPSAEELARKPFTRTYVEDVNAGTLASDVWTDMPSYQPLPEEKTAYPTQKPEALLVRLISAGSGERDLVLDCFCGSGTTAAVAEKLNRRWIACDLGRFAIHTTRKRLLSLRGVRPFVVQNLGKYERQVWQTAEFKSQIPNAKSQAPITTYQLQKAYTEFILKLYGARPIAGYTWLHGLKAGRMVHVGAVDAPVALGDVAQIVAEFKKSIGKGKDAPTQKGVDALGWDFAFELHEVAKQQAAQAGIDLRFFRIPNDVMDKRAVEQGDVRFFELAALSVDLVGAGLAPARKGATARVAPTERRTVTLTLTDFVIPPDDVPEDVQKTVTHWSQWIDYWAVDWDYKGDAFHNQWQTYRTRQSQELQKSVTHTYAEPGTYTVMVKVIDILGNDTTKTIRVEIK
jgi:DNA modification methylase